MCSTCERICSSCGGEKSPNEQICLWCLRKWENDVIVDDDVITKDFSPKMRDLLVSVFDIGKVSPEYVDKLLENKEEFLKVFTSKSYDPINNYEIYEHLGDSIVGAFLSWYFYRRFPQLNCAHGVKFISKLKAKYASKKSFSDIAENLGFWPFIRATEEERNINKKSLLEDVFEAFIGVTVKLLDDDCVIGAGYSVVYKILEGIFDDIEIGLERDDLYDPKSTLKELFDKGHLGKLQYEDVQNKSSVYRIINGLKLLMGEGTGHTQKERQQNAAKNALKALEDEGIGPKATTELFCDQ